MKKEEIKNYEEIEELLDYTAYDDLESIRTEDFREWLLAQTIALTDYYADEMLNENDVLKFINYAHNIFSNALENSEEFINGKKVLKVSANPIYWDGEKVFFHSEFYAFKNIKNIEFLNEFESFGKAKLLEAMTGLDQEFPPDYLTIFEYREDEYLLERDWGGDLEYYTMDEALEEWMTGYEEEMLIENENADSDDIETVFKLQGYQVVILERSRFLDHSHLDEIEKYLQEGYKLIRNVDFKYIEKAEELNKKGGWYDNVRSVETFVNNCLYTTLVK
ncbi:hypothetical protein [Clostridium perfringens]|jgi:hypothetical protein